MFRFVNWTLTSVDEFLTRAMEAPNTRIQHGPRAFAQFETDWYALSACNYRPLRIADTLQPRPCFPDQTIFNRNTDSRRVIIFAPSRSDKLDRVPGFVFQQRDCVAYRPTPINTRTLDR